MCKVTCFCGILLSLTMIQMSWASYDDFEEPPNYRTISFQGNLPLQGPVKHFAIPISFQEEDSKRFLTVCFLMQQGTWEEYNHYLFFIQGDFIHSVQQAFTEQSYSARLLFQHSGDFVGVYKQSPVTKTKIVWEDRSTSFIFWDFRQLRCQWANFNVQASKTFSLINPQN